jgi:hypothetical protein
MITRIYPVDLCKVSATSVQTNENDVVLYVEYYWKGRDPFMVFDDFTEALRVQQVVRAGLRGDFNSHGAYSINDDKFTGVEVKKATGLKAWLLKLLKWRGYK